jgi:hypothetical protein
MGHREGNSGSGPVASSPGSEALWTSSHRTSSFAYESKTSEMLNARSFGDFVLAMESSTAHSAGETSAASSMSSTAGARHSPMA